MDQVREDLEGVLHNCAVARLQCLHKAGQQGIQHAQHGGGAPSQAALFQAPLHKSQREHEQEVLVPR